MCFKRTTACKLFKQSAESRATIFSYIANDKPTTGAFKQATRLTPESPLTLAKNSCHFLRGAIFLSTHPFLTNYTFGYFSRELFVTDRIIYQHVGRDTKVLFVLSGFSSSRRHVFVALWREKRKRSLQSIEITDVASTMTRTTAFFFRNCYREIRGAARPVFIRNTVYKHQRE